MIQLRNQLHSLINFELESKNHIDLSDHNVIRPFDFDERMDWDDKLEYFCKSCAFTVFFYFYQTSSMKSIVLLYPE